jgi:hypothetical protein
MAATTTAVLAQMFGSSLKNAFAQTTTQATPQNLDILQINIPGDNASNLPTVAVNVDWTGVVHNPAVAPTDGTRAGVYMAGNLLASATTAQFFANAFANPSLLDILQVVNLGGKISYWLDYLGVAHGA